MVEGVVRKVLATSVGCACTVQRYVFSRRCFVEDGWSEFVAGDVSVHMHYFTLVGVDKREFKILFESRCFCHEPKFEGDRIQFNCQIWRFPLTFQRTDDGCYEFTSEILNHFGLYQYRLDIHLDIPELTYAFIFRELQAYLPAVIIDNVVKTYYPLHHFLIN